MKIEKLERKYVAPYLSHDVYAYDEEQESKTDKIVGLFHNTLDFENWSPLNSNIDHYKLCLLPLSALTEPLEDGTVPIVELAKIADSDVNVIECKFSNAIYGVKYLDEVGVECVFAFNSNFNSFGLHEGVTEEFHVVPYQDKLFEYLYSKHFDIFDLIGNNLALDKRRYGK